MGKYRRTAFITLGVLGLVIVGAATATYFLAAPGGYFEREQADIRLSSSDDSNPYTALDGSAVNLADLQGKPFVINVWATWSPYSANELPALSALQAEFGDRVTIVALNRNETPATVAAYRSTIGDTQNLIFVQDSNDYFFSTIGGYAMPETIFYNATGNIVERVRGTLTENDFRTMIMALLGQS